MKKTVIVFVVLIELLVVVFLILQINRKKKNVLGVSVNVIRRNTIDFPNTNSPFLENYYEPKPNQQEKQSEKWLSFTPTYSINSDTLNNTKNYSVDKKSKTYRIVTVGDSFTFGQYVNTKDNWSELLEAELNHKCSKNTYEVINLGVHGYDLAYSVYRYIFRGEKYDPDLVIYLLKDDDFSEIMDITGRIRWKFTSDLESDSANEDMLSKGTSIKNQKAFEAGIKELRKRYTSEEVMDYQFNNLKQLANINRKLLIMNVFAYPQPILNRINELVRGKTNVMFEPNKLQIEQLHDPKYSYLPFDAHPNNEGHILIKNKVVNYLIDNKVVPCN